MRLGTHHESNFARPAGCYWCGRLFGGIDQRRGVLSFLNHHQSEFGERANRQDGPAVGKNSHGAEVRYLRESCEPFRPASVRRKPDHVNGPVHHTGVETIARPTFQEPDCASDGK
jgi:hypothetical protein